MVPVIDMHCDTMALIRNVKVQTENRKKGIELQMISCFKATKDELENGLSFRENHRMIDAKRLKASSYLCQCLGLCSSERSAANAGVDPWEYLLMISDTCDGEVAANADLVRPVTTGTEMEKVFAEGVAPVMKTIEDSMALGGDLEKLAEMYRRGVRVASLTWNFENELGFGHRYVTDPETGKKSLVLDTENGLKPAGFEFVKAMEEMGVILDISHLNDAGIRDAFAAMKKSTPIIATHSNARALCPHPRNLPDEFLRELADRGGITGINFCHAFLNPECMDDSQKYSRIEDMTAHMKYIRNVAGIDTIGLGSDFDGITSDVDFYGCGEIHMLEEGMEKAGFTDDEIEKVFYRNALRVFKEVLG